VKRSMLISLAVGVLVCGNSMSDFAPKPVKFYSYHSSEPGCRANHGTDMELVVGRGGEQWVIVAPARVVSTESERRRAGGPLDIEIAEPLESSLRKRLGDDSRREEQIDSGRSSVTRIKIVSVSHDVAGLGMGVAQAHIRLDFYICVNGDVPESSVVKTVTRNGPNISTLWHQPRGQELQDGFRKAADGAFSAIVDFALHRRE
jgi:hypothetical protein